MTQYNPTFNVKNYELRGYTNPFLNPEQTNETSNVETRVNGQLNFLAQMLGWNGPNYWTNLATTVDQKRQLLGGTFGVYNSFIIPRVYEVRAWDNSIVIYRGSLFPASAQFSGIDKVVIGNLEYEVQSVSGEGELITVSIGELTDEFLTLFESGEPLRVSYPSARPAPFYRPNVGASGDYSFSCGKETGSLTLYPAYDTAHRFPVRFPVLFLGSTYYFDQPVYLSLNTSLTPDVTPNYDPELSLWVLQLPFDLDQTLGTTAYLAWANSNVTQANNFSLEVTLQEWFDPSDWGSTDVLTNFIGTWGNKGGTLPFNFAFDALSIHGFDEKNSIFLPNFSQNLGFNDLVNYVYYQKTVVSPSAPPGPKVGDLWWNDETGVLAVWFPSVDGCSHWVEVDYRQTPNQAPTPEVVYPDVATFRALSPTLPDGAVVRIDDVTGLTNPTDNVLGLNGTVTVPGFLVLHKQVGTPYWVPDEFRFVSVSDFAVASAVLPYNVPVLLFDSNGLQPDGGSYSVRNLSVALTGQYELRLLKQYADTVWEVYPDSFLKFIAFSAMFGSPVQGELWWDYVNSDPKTRSAAVYYSSPSPISSLSILDPGSNLVDGVYTGVNLVSLAGTGGLATVDLTVVGGIATSVALANPGDLYQLGDVLGPDSLTFPSLVGVTFEVQQTASQDWVALNQQMQSGPPSPLLNLGTLLFYCNGQLLQDGVSYITDNFDLTYTSNPATGEYEFNYNPYTFVAKAQLPKVTISDSNTTVYRADITDLVFSGIRYFISPNVYNAETPLRLWKSQALQVVETLEHLAEDNYVNPLRADLNTGPGPENWEKYFIRLPFDYGRNEETWQRVALVCQNFATYGSSVVPEVMSCPPEDDLPAIYEELFLYDQPVPDFTYVYSEPYLYSNLGYSNNTESGQYQNAGVFPASDVEFDDFFEANLTEYDPLHNRQADVTSPVSAGYGNWLGEYVNVNPCQSLTGHLVTDLLSGGVEPVAPPVWDASIYKFAPTCESEAATYNVDSNHFKLGYAYFVADASAAEDAFFDISQEASWRYPETQPRTSYSLARQRVKV
jgi:hypothetical protein